MRLFAIFCYAIALYYGYTAVETMQSGVAYPIRGDTSVPHLRDEPDSRYQKYLMARWLFAGGFIALGAVMQVFAGRFDKLSENNAAK
jgi:hypothetical protein